MEDMRKEKEMTFQDVDKITSSMNEKEFEIFVGKLPGDIAKVFIERRPILKLFCNREYYEAVKKAVCERIEKEIYG